MYSEKTHHIHFYNAMEQPLFITEFGHSRRTAPRKVGPYIRDEWILHIVIRDTCRFCDMDVRAGDCFLIAKGQLHSLAVEAGYEHYWLAFDGAGASGLTALFALDLNEHRKLHVRIPPGELEALVHDTFEHADDALGERRAAALLLHLLAHLAPPEDPPVGWDYVRAACAYMTHNYHRRIRMEEVARAVNLSEKHLCRLFRRELSTSPMQYLVKLRMEQARQLLATTDMRIKDIAATVGYPSQLAFSAAFSAHWGCSPTDARTQSAKEKDPLLQRVQPGQFH